MKACVSGATGFLGAHVVRRLCERGDDVRIVYRDPARLRALGDLKYRRRKGDVLDFQSMRRAAKGADVLFHTAGFVGSSPQDLVWRVNAEAPVVAVEACAAEGVKRVVMTSTISAVGLPDDGHPATERTEYPADWLGLSYPDSKHEGERAALEAGERHGVEVVVVNPAYLFGVPVDGNQPGETSTRTIGNYLRGRLPAVIDARMTFADVEDVAAGHLLAAERGRPGERYILGAEDLSWPALIDRVAELSGVHYPVMVMPPQISRVARVRAALGLPGVVSVQGYELMAKDWRFSSAKAERELGYRARPLDDTLAATIAWYLELIEQGAFGEADRSAMSSIAGGIRRAGTLGLLSPVRMGQRLVGRRVLAGV